MPLFEITAPDGRRFEVEGPEGATAEQALEQVRAQYRADWWKTTAAIPGTTLGQLKKAVGGTLQATAEAAPTPEQMQSIAAPGTAAEELAKATEKLKPKPTTEVGKVGAGIAELGEEQIKEAHPGEMSFWQRAYLSGVSSAATQVPTLALSIASRSVAPSLAAAGIQAGGSTYAESRAKGSDVASATAHAATDASVEVIMEMIPTKFLLEHAGGPIIKLITGTLAREVPTEVLTTAVQSANARLRDRELTGEAVNWEEYGQDILDTVGSTMISAPLLGGAAKVLSPLDRQRSGQAPTAAPQGEDNAPLSPPFDQPTVVPDTPAQDNISALIASIDADLLDDKAVAQAQEVIKKHEELRKTDPQKEAAWAPFALAPRADEDVGELGASRKQTAKAKEYENPNTGDRLDRPFLYGPEGVEGLTMRSVAMQPATYTLGVESADRPADYLRAIHDTVESWRQQYMPQATFVISNENLYTDSALGSHLLVGPNQHMIVPAVLRSPSKGLGAFNMNTQASAFYNLSHEFGHALLKERFLEGIEPTASLTLLQSSVADVVPEELIGTLPEPQQAVVREFNAIKQRIMDNSLTAQEFVDLWMSPGKLGRATFLKDLGVAPTDNAVAVGLALVRRAGARQNVNDAGGEKLKAFRQRLLNDFFSLEEYIAEQTARHAYNAKWDKTSPLGQFFQKALESLRKFFAGLKKDGAIAPGTAFTEWIEGLSKGDRALTQGERIAAGKKKGGKPKVQAAKPAQGQKKPAAATITYSPKLEPSGFQPKQNIFNTPALQGNRTFAWRSMGESEFRKLLSGEKQYVGDKAASKGNFLAGIPESAAQYGGKGRYLVEFAKVRIAGDEGLLPGSVATRDNISAVWRHDGSVWVSQPPPFEVAAPKVKVAKVQHNVESDTEAETLARMGKLLDTLQQMGSITEQRKAELQKMLDSQDFDGFADEIAKITAKNVKFELDDSMDLDFTKMIETMSALRSGMDESVLNNPKLRAEAEGEWQREQFRSRFFKAWFGDWELNPEKASKIRRGAIISAPAASLLPGPDGWRAFSVELEKSIFGSKEPLVVYHATRAQAVIRKGKLVKVPRSAIQPADNTDAFTKFNRGDIGFHFGTVRAAHDRIDAAMPAGVKGPILPTEEWRGGGYIIPAALNIRNPLFIGTEEGWNWGSPYHVAEALVRRRIITDQDYADIVVSLDANQSPSQATDYDPTFDYEDFAPIRETLLKKGFDGLVYINGAEDPGSFSFVAFHPNQVKSLLGARMFTRSDNMHFELDLDASKPESVGARRMMTAVKDFVSDFPRLRRAFRKMTHAVYQVVELQQLAHLNPDVSELALMNEKNGEYNRYKSRLQAHADSVLNDWNSLGKENWHKLNKFMIAEAEGKELWYDLKKTQITRDGRPTLWYEYVPNAKTAEMAQKFGLDERLAAIALQAKNVLLSQINEAELALLSILGKRYANAGQDVLTAAFVPIKRQIHEFRKYPFFPQGRFGNRVLIVEKKKTDGPGWEIVWREHFEKAAEWEKAWKHAESRKAPDERIRKEELSDQSYVLMSLPTEFVDLAASELGLSDQQLDILMSILQPVKRDKVLSVYDQQRLGIKGYSTDAMRSFANFTWHNSNLLAKLIYRADFNWAIRGVGVKLREAKYSDAPESMAQVERLQRIKTYMEKVRDYVMAPPNEAQMLRATVSIAYLGLNPKTALLNTYGLITTWSDLTSRFGQIEGNKLFLKASYEAFRSLKLTSLNERRAGQYLSPEKQQALDKAIEEGVLSQSYAYHLAGLANAGNTYRLGGAQALGNVKKQAIDVAMYLFRLTELSTRRASFLAEFEAARKDPNLSVEEAYQIAVERTNKLQNDYSLGNRVPFMRGFKLDKGNPLGKVVEPVVPLATVFMSFAQHMAFHAYGGYELGERRMAKQLGEIPRTVFGGYTMKIWLVTLLLAGYEGLPGAENLLDMLEIAWRKWGGQKPMRQELREMVQALEVDPQLAARGLSHNIAGFDVSRSLGFGRFVPGTDVLAHPRDSVSEQLGILMLDLAGPTGGFIKFGLEAVFGDKPKAQAFERLPGGAGNIYTAYRWSQYGVRAPSGALITHDLETGKLRDLTADEIFGKALGFNPTIVSQNREIRFNQYDRKVYWQSRREMLLRDLFTARVEKDREAEADVKKAIVEYNAGVPAEYRELRLTGADIARSLQARQRVKRADEKQTTSQRRYKPLYEDIKESFGRP